MTVSAAPLQKEIYFHNPMMKGMTNYFPLAGSRWARPGGGRGSSKGGGGDVCALINPYYSASRDPTVSLRKLADAFNDTLRLTGGR